MLPAEDLFACVYALIDDAVKAGAVAPFSAGPGQCRPGSVPARTDAELLTIAVVGRLLGRCCEAGFLAEVAHDWGVMFARLPYRSEAGRRIRWLRGRLRAAAGHAGGPAA